jgi:hypothetical protein
MEQYSKTIYPAFLWYAFSALKANETAFSLSDFRNIVKLHYVDLTANGQPTIDWVARQVKSKLNYLERDYPNYPEQINNFAEEIKLKCDVRPENCYMFMQGHTLMDNVVLVAMKSVCNKLKDNMITIITNSSQRGKTLKNELSNYNNSLRNIEDVIQTNMGFDSCPQYQYIRKDLKRFVDNFNTNRQ